MRCDPDHLTALVADIWGTQVDEELVAAGFPDDVSVGDVAAVVGIAGDVFAAVAVSMSRASAARFAASMFGAVPDSGALADAVCEFGNQLAGGVKGLLDGECRLEVPRVVEPGLSWVPQGAEVVTSQSWLALDGVVSAWVWRLPEDLEGRW